MPKLLHRPTLPDGTAPIGEASVFEQTDGTGQPRILVRLSGDWSIQTGLPPTAPMLKALADARSSADATPVSFECSALGKYDSSLVAFLLELHRQSAAQGIALDMSALPPRAGRLLALALARPAADGTDAVAAPAVPLFQHVGEWGRSSANSWLRTLDFIGQTMLALWNLVRGKARTRFSECWFFIQACGADALPIISLIAFLTGLILAYIGAVQMKQFGATQYVAGMVGLAMVREMGALMAGVILCGRTATAYAAQLGSMQVSEEIAAFRVLGISPVEYLVLPRMIAVFFMMPLLTLYANLCGILGGLVVMTSMDVTFGQYYNMLIRTINMPNFLSGLIKSFFFAILIAWAGCFRGMICGKSSQAVGDAATSAAVMGITLLVIADAIFAVLFDAINFF
jgi:phospholipid/cholesterol/gamma-HCH transport system permease protein